MILPSQIPWPLLIWPVMTSFQVMSYETGGPWDRCFWYWYEHHADFEYCSYDMASDGTVKQHKCKPDSLVIKFYLLVKTCFTPVVVSVIKSSYISLREYEEV